MQVKTQRSISEDAPRDVVKKKTSCFSNIKIFLVAECALMLAQGTVGAYLVSEGRLSVPPLLLISLTKSLDEGPIALGCTVPRVNMFLEELHRDWDCWD